MSSLHAVLSSNSRANRRASHTSQSSCGSLHSDDLGMPLVHTLGDMEKQTSTSCPNLPSRLAHSNGGLPMHREHKTCCGVRMSFMLQLLAIMAFCCLWGYLFSLSQRAKLSVCSKATDQLHLEVDSLHQTLTAERSQVPDTGVSQWREEAMLNKLQTRVIELEAGLKEAQDALHQCQGENALHSPSFTGKEKSDKSSKTSKHPSSKPKKGGRKV